MMEVGPWRFDGKDSLKQKEGGWEEYANVLYSKSPSNTLIKLFLIQELYLYQLTSLRELASLIRAQTATFTS